MKTNKRGTVISGFVAIRDTSDMPSDSSPNWSRVTIDDPAWNEQGPPGADGHDGLDGAPGRDGVDGRDGAAETMNPRGEHRSGRVYRRLDIARVDGEGSFVCVVDETKTTPSEFSTNWMMLCKDGETPEAPEVIHGQRGPRGRDGTTTTVVVGSGEPMEAIFDTAAAGGMAVFVSSNGHVDLAQADAFATSVPVGLAIAAVSGGAAGQYLTGGPITLEDWTLATGAEFLEPGKIYFLSVDTAGQLVLTTSEVSGTYVVIMGTALTQTTFNIEIHRALVNG